MIDKEKKEKLIKWLKKEFISSANNPDHVISQIIKKLKNDQYETIEEYKEMILHNYTLADSQDVSGEYALVFCPIYEKIIKKINDIWNNTEEKDGVIVDGVTTIKIIWKSGLNRQLQKAAVSRFLGEYAGKWFRKAGASYYFINTENDKDVVEVDISKKREPSFAWIFVLAENDNDEIKITFTSN